MADKPLLTPEVNTRAIEHLGYEIDQRALTLISYLLPEVMLNGPATVIPNTVLTDDDKFWLKRWNAEKLIKWSAPHIKFSRRFYVSVCEILWHSYIKEDQ